MRIKRPEWFSEGLARGSIIILFACVLLCCILFAWTAVTAGARTPDPAPAAYMEVQQEKLAIELALSQEVQRIEAQLAAAREENQRMIEKNQELHDENAELSEAQVTLLDSLVLDYVGEYYATSYCCERYPHICGGNGVTASGTVPTPGLTCAADWSVLPPGTWLYIEGVGLRRVEDSGSAIKGKKVDIAVDTHANALRWRGQGYHHTWVLRFEGLTE